MENMDSEKSIIMAMQLLMKQTESLINQYNNIHTESKDEEMHSQDYYDETCSSEGYNSILGLMKSCKKDSKRGKQRTFYYDQSNNDFINAFSEKYNMQPSHAMNFIVSYFAKTYSEEIGDVYSFELPDEGTEG